jgi:hypothetical protein
MSDVGENQVVNYSANACMRTTPEREAPNADAVNLLLLSS